MIRMTCGIYGLRDGLTVRPKTAKDGPFEAGAPEEARLVAAGVAEYVTDPGAEGRKPDAGTETPGQAGNAAPESDAGAQPEGLEGMKYNDLQKIAKKLGVGGNGSRNELIEKIRNAKEPEDGERDAEEPDGDVPGFTAELPA